MRVERRIPFYTNPAKRILAKIPNPSPRTLGAPVELLDGSVRFYNFNSLAQEASANELPPLLPESKKLPLTDFSILARMRELRGQHPRYWTITRLSKEFGVHRSLVIDRILTSKEQQRAREELNDQIDRMGLTKKRGLIMRYRIREHRRDL